MTLPSELTLLVMTPIGVPLYSARGLTQTYTPVAEAKPAMRRTINGEARFIGGSQMRKYDSVITCTDQNAPPLSGVWPGDIIVVDCVFELSYKTSGGSAERTIVSGSSHVVGEYTLYRPRMVFLVVDYETSFQEYEAENQCRLSLTEQ